MIDGSAEGHDGFRGGGRSEGLRRCRAAIGASHRDGQQAGCGARGASEGAPPRSHDPPGLAHRKRPAVLRGEPSAPRGVRRGGTGGARRVCAAPRRADAHGADRVRTASCRPAGVGVPQVLSRGQRAPAARRSVHRSYRGACRCRAAHRRAAALVSCCHASRSCPPGDMCKPCVFGKIWRAAAPQGARSSETASPSRGSLRQTGGPCARAKSRCSSRCARASS